MYIFVLLTYHVNIPDFAVCFVELNYCTLKITYLGHSCLLIEVAQTQLLFDPYLPPNTLARLMDTHALKVDYICLSHNHHSHVADVARILHQHPVTLIANLAITDWHKQQGAMRTMPIKPGATKKFDFGAITAVHEPHANFMPDGTYAGSAMGFVLQSADKALYFAGDTALHQDMQQIRTCYHIDFAILPISGVFTMDLEETLHAADYVGSDKIIGIHYDSFSGIRLDPNVATQRAQQYGKTLILMDVGQTIQC